jgi:hypothetical protein
MHVAAAPRERLSRTPVLRTLLAITTSRCRNLIQGLGRGDDLFWFQPGRRVHERRRRDELSSFPAVSSVCRSAEQGRSAVEGVEYGQHGRPAHLGHAEADEASGMSRRRSSPTVRARWILRRYRGGSRSQGPSTMAPGAPVGRTGVAPWGIAGSVRRTRQWSSRASLTIVMLPQGQGQRLSTSNLNEAEI